MRNGPGTVTCGSRRPAFVAAFCAGLAATAGSAWLEGIDEVAERAVAAPRRPSALVLTESDRQLWVANERTGTVSLIDTDRLVVVDEFAVGERLTDLLGAPGPDRMLALDGGAHQLLVLSRSSGREPGLEVLHRVPVGPYPVRASSGDGGKRCFVTSLWSRRLDVFDVLPDAPPRRTRSIDLPYAPREQLLLNESRLLVAAAFGGELAVVDLERGELARGFELPIHNIRGLALSGGEGPELVIAHQSLSPYATTSRDDVFWGILLANRVLLVQMESVLSPTGEVLRHSRGLDLGDPANPAGDPDRVALTSKGELAIALAGAGRVAMGRTDWPRLDHVRVGRRPTALVASADGGRLYVANTLSDSVSVIDVATRRRLGDVALGPPAPLTESDRGEALFFDAGLSLRGWMSCHSCHTDGHANGAVVDTLGDGGFGAPKRVPSLLGVGESGPWAWNGSVAELEEQVAKSVHSTLRNASTTPDEVRALASFLRTLHPPELPLEGEEDARQRGQAVFRTSGCGRCHTPPALTSARPRDVGLVDEVGNRFFNPPSLRGVRHRSSFLHDGRARRLRDVFSVHGHPRAELSEAEIDDLVAFLSTL